MEFLYGIMPGLITSGIIIVLSIIGNLIFIQVHKRNLTKKYIEEGMTPPEWDWLYREKKPKKK